MRPIGFQLLGLLVLGLQLRASGADAVRDDDGAAPRAAGATNAVDLRPVFAKWNLQPRNQGSRSTCSVFTLTVALEFAAAQVQQRGTRFSPEYLNWAANETGRGHEDGGFFSDMWAGFVAKGICLEERMPYLPQFDASRTPTAAARAEAKEQMQLGLKLHWIKRWNVNTGLSANEFRRIQQTLESGWPVCSGLRWPKADVWKNDVLEMCPPEQVFDGHSVLLVGYREDATQPGGGVFIFRNTNRGGRDGFMPYEYARAYMNDALWISSESSNGSSSNSTAPRQQVSRP